MIDAHHHLLDPDRYRYGWLSAPDSPLRRVFDVDDLREAIGAEPVEATIAVQSSTSLAETDGLLRAADGDGPVTGVVGWVDLLAGNVAGQLRELRARPGGERLVGVRHPAHDEPDANWLARPAVIAGVRELGEAGLCFDLLVRSRELPAAVRLAEAAPSCRMVLDHIGKPPLAAAARGAPTSPLAPWRRSVRSLQELENVTVKLSGLLTETDGDERGRDAALAVLGETLELFGAARCMFGSDWPVCNLRGGYAPSLALVREALADRAPAEARQVMRTTALRCYRLQPLLKERQALGVAER